LSHTFIQPTNIARGILPLIGKRAVVVHITDSNNEINLIFFPPD